ncbi:MAG: hypothetical protein ACI3XM_05440 [Eubacteriales bacterium]
MKYYVFRDHGWSSSSIQPGETFDMDKILAEDEWIAQEIENGGVFGHMTEEDEAELLSIFENVTLVADRDTEIIDLIREDVSAYFSGAKSLEDTVSVVQSRVSIYISETRG